MYCVQELQVASGRLPTLRDCPGRILQCCRHAQRGFIITEPGTSDRLRLPSLRALRRRR